MHALLLRLRRLIVCCSPSSRRGWDLRVFWTDDNSNYAGLYVSGPLAGKVCWIDHGEIDPSPVYASVYSFLRTQIETLSEDEELEWDELPRDYPALRRSGDRRARHADHSGAGTAVPIQ